MSFFFNDTPTTEIYTFPTRRSSDLSSRRETGGSGQGEVRRLRGVPRSGGQGQPADRLAQPHRLHLRSEEHKSELQSRRDLVCRLLLEKKKKIKTNRMMNIKTDTTST